MKTWRLLDTPPMSAAENMALDEVLIETRSAGSSPDTLRFLQFSPRTVLLGIHQSVAEEIRLDYCRRNNIDINRRITGGGAIFFDENQLGWEIICSKKVFNVVVPDDRLFRTLCRPVQTALGTLGLDASFRPRNDIEINGKKISGTGGTDAGDAFLFQGTMLVDFDVDTMLRCLKIPIEKLKSKEIDSFKDRVTCLNWELGYTPELSAIKTALAESFEKHLDIRLEPSGLTGTEKQLFREKLEKFKSVQWVDSVRPNRNRRETVQSTYKAEAGMIRCTLAVDPDRKRLKDIYITGDFISFPSRALYDLEAALRGSPLRKDRLYPVIKNFFSEGKIIIPGMTEEDFIKPFGTALEKIEIAEFGIPIEYCNMISVTNGSFREIVGQKPSVLLLPYCAKLTDCNLRYEKGCRICGKKPCSIGPAWQMGLDHGLRVVSVVNFEDLWEELSHLKKNGEKAFLGCCCQPFFAKHFDDFTRLGMPGILLDIDNTTCYELDQAKQAYDGKFENLTLLNLNLLSRVLEVCTTEKGKAYQGDAA